MFDASPRTILDTLADMDALPSWSRLHREVTVLDRHPDGRPHHVRATMRLMGVTDRELLEYHWGEDWVVWDAKDTFQQRGQHAEYNLTPEGEMTRVRFDITVDPSAPVPRFLLKRAKSIVLDTAIDRLRSRVTRNRG